MRFGTACTSSFALLFLAAIGSTGSTVALGACVDPSKDYDNFLARTASETIPSSDASFDSAVPEAGVGSLDAGFTGQYVMACVSQVDDSDPKEATYFQIFATFRPAASGGGGTFDFADQALPLGPGSPPSPPTTTAGAVGAIASVNGSVVTPDGHCDVVFGPTVVPGAADAVVVGADIYFTNSTLHFIIGPGSQLCAELGGTVTSPLQVTLDPPLNICALTATTGPVSPLTQADVHCP
jgi:hypothetical protein